MSLYSSFRGISKKSLSPTLWTPKRPRRVIASEVITRLYGRGLGVPLAPARPAVESEAGAPAGPAAGRAWPGAPEGAGLAGGVVVRAQAESRSTGSSDRILYRMIVLCGFTEGRSGRL